MNSPSAVPLRQRLMSAVAAVRNRASGQSLGDQLLRGGLGVAVVKLASIAVTFGATVVVARALGAEEFGVYSFIAALITIATVLAQFGLAGLVLRETARSLATGDYARMLGSWRWSRRIAFFTSSGLVVVGLAVAAILGSSVPALGSKAFFLGLPIIPVLAFGALRAGTLRGLGKVALALFPELVLLPTALIGIVATLWLFAPSSLDATWAMAAHLTAAALSFSAISLFLHRARPIATTTDVEPTFDPAWRKSVVPMAVIMGVPIFFRQIDTIMIGFLTTETEVGLYRVAAQWGWLVTLGSQIVNVTIQPVIPRLYAAKDLRGLEVIAQRAGIIAILTSLPPLLVFLLFGETVISLAFGPTFAGAHLPLAILSVGHFLGILTGPSGPLLAFTNYERDVAVVLALAVLSIIALTIVAVPYLGIAGAAVAGAIAQFGHNLVLRSVVKRRLGITPMKLGRIGKGSRVSPRG